MTLHRPTHMHKPRTLTVLYGSQTGCAQEVSERIVREARRLAYSVYTASMDEYDRERIVRDELVIFVCSTTGQGEEPDNMKVILSNLPRWSMNLRKLS